MFTKEQVSKHCTKDDCWIIIDSNVYDVTKFMQQHPGGEKVLLQVGGKDATKQFYSLHQKSVLQKYNSFKVGIIGGNYIQSITTNNKKNSVVTVHNR